MRSLTRGGWAPFSRPAGIRPLHQHGLEIIWASVKNAQVKRVLQHMELAWAITSLEGEGCILPNDIIPYDISTCFYVSPDQGNEDAGRRDAVHTSCCFRRKAKFPDFYRGSVFHQGVSKIVQLIPAS